MRRKQCDRCRNQLHYMWIGEGYKREVQSCREHLPMNTGRCRMYKEKDSKDTVG